MKFTTAIVAAMATLAAAAPAEKQAAGSNPDLYLSSSKPAPKDDKPKDSSTGNKCADCVNYCHNDSNGLALGAACLIVKCGISCIIA